MTLFPEWQAEHGGKHIDKKLAAMHTLYGTKPGHICGECMHFQRYRQSATWFKCDLNKMVGSSTDWRYRWLACGKFEGEPKPTGMTMKAITLTQPWATLVALGLKVTETRSWRTAYRGPLAIHAAKGLTKEAVQIGYSQPFRQHLKAAGYTVVTAMPRGAIVATCQLVDCVPTDKYQGKDMLDFAFGDYSSGRWAWKLEEIKPLDKPIPARGALSLWDWLH